MMLLPWRRQAAGRCPLACLQRAHTRQPLHPGVAGPSGSRSASSSNSIRPVAASRTASLPVLEHQPDLDLLAPAPAVRSGRCRPGWTTRSTGQAPTAGNYYFPQQACCRPTGARSWRLGCRHEPSTRPAWAHGCSTHPSRAGVRSAASRSRRSTDQARAGQTPGRRHDRPRCRVSEVVR